MTAQVTGSKLMRGLRRCHTRCQWQPLSPFATDILIFIYNVFLNTFVCYLFFAWVFFTMVDFFMILSFYSFSLLMKF